MYYNILIFKFDVKVKVDLCNVGGGGVFGVFVSIDRNGMVIIEELIVVKLNV